MRSRCLTSRTAPSSVTSGPALSAQATPAPIVSAGPVYAAPVPTRQPLRRRRTEHTEKLTLYVKPETVQRVHHYSRCSAAAFRERSWNALSTHVKGDSSDCE